MRKQFKSFDDVVKKIFNVDNVEKSTIFFLSVKQAFQLKSIFMENWISKC